MLTAETVKNALDFGAYYRAEVGELKPGTSGNHLALCPFHEDMKPSLSVNLQSGLYLCFGCQAKGDVFDFYRARHKCDFPTALKELAEYAGVGEGNGTRARKSGKITATFDYQDEKGQILFQVVRSEPKKFWQRRPDGKGGWINEVKSLPGLVPYHLPELLQADTIYIGEGEEDVDRLRSLGLTATTNPMGARKWRGEYNQHFKGKAVIILPDNDKPGLDHAQDVARNLHGVAASVKVVELPGLPDKGDVSDWLKAGGTKEDLLKLAGEAPNFQNNPFPDVISAADLENLVFPEIEHLIKDIMPFGFGLISARPKKGKTFLALNIAAAKATGGCALGKKDLRLEQGTVLYIAYEDKKQRVKNRLTTIMQGEPFPPKLYVAETWPRLSDGGLDNLSKWLTAYPDTKLVVIDTLGRFKPRKRAKEDPYEADLATGAALADLAHKHNVCILGVYHNRKAESDDPLDDVHGSTGMTAAADFVMVLKRGRGQADAELFVTGREIEEKTLALRFHKSEGLWELLGTAEEVAKSQARQDIFLILKENGPGTTKELSEIINKKGDTIKKLLYRMKGDNEVRLRNGKWELM